MESQDVVLIATVAIGVFGCASYVQPIMAVTGQLRHMSYDLDDKYVVHRRWSAWTQGVGLYITVWSLSLYYVNTGVPCIWEMAFVLKATDAIGRLYWVFFMASLPFPLFAVITLLDTIRWHRAWNGHQTE